VQIDTFPFKRRFMGSTSSTARMLEARAKIEIRVKNETSATDFLPSRQSLLALRTAAKECEGCPLFERATQVVFGEGAKSASLMLVGEQPGDSEDVAGRPFVGPAGSYLRNELERVGISTNDVYLTNAVKHFKWEPRGKKRLHSKPAAREVAACRPWLEAEVAQIQPVMLVALGATAAFSLFGRNFQLSKRRGKPFRSDWAQWTLATYHPSAVLRTKAHAGGGELIAHFQYDLRLVAQELGKQRKKQTH
jgi:uracil-DNA glycosylase